MHLETHISTHDEHIYNYKNIGFVGFRNYWSCWFLFVDFYDTCLNPPWHNMSKKGLEPRSLEPIKPKPPLPIQRVGDE